jgi:hypothetical protein
MLGISAFVLWAFVFAWYPQAAGRPVLAFPRSVGLWGLTLAGAGFYAVTLAWFVDPVLRPLSPQDYPVTRAAWGAATAFQLGFGQLFTLFAPLAFMLRLTGRREVAIACTSLLGFGLMRLQLDRLGGGLPTLFLLQLGATKLAFGVLALWLFLRGGIGLLWVWGLVLQARLWPGG